MTQYIDTIICKKLNEVYFHLQAEKSTLKELSEHLTFMVPGYQYMPAYKHKVWDGKIRLVNLKDRTVYIGLYKYIEEFCKNNNYEFKCDDIYLDPFSLKEADDFFNILKISSNIEKRDYQLEAFAHAIKYKRCLLLSSTSSGKSFLMYMIMRYLNKRTLIIVPTVTLVEQLYSDFKEYGFNSDKFIDKIYDGKNRNSNKPIIISTWQSIFNLDSEWFQQFEVVIGDEAHNFKADSLKRIMEQLYNCEYRIATTGTLDGTKTNQIVIEGLFGPIKQVVKTKELMDSGTISQLLIRNIVLKYDYNKTTLINDSSYINEINYIINNKNRNEFIINLALSLKGNGLILYQYVDNHGKPLFELLKSNNKDRKLFFVSGSVDGKIRNEYRKEINESTNSITVASSGTFSTGINIPNINWIILASPTKSKVKILQSIGRGLRKSIHKDTFEFLDIIDDISNKKKINHTLRHGLQRLKYYAEEGFNVKTYNIRLKETC